MQDDNIGLGSLFIIVGIMRCTYACSYLFPKTKQCNRSLDLEPDDTQVIDDVDLESCHVASTARRTRPHPRSMT